MRPGKVIQAAIKELIAPALKKQGFRKERDNFWRDCGDVVDVIRLDTVGKTDSCSAIFHVRLALYWKHLQELLGQDCPEPYYYFDCAIRTTIGAMRRASPSTTPTGFGSKVTKELLTIGLPWLEKGHDPEVSIAYLQDTIAGFHSRNKIEILRREGKIPSRLTVALTGRE